MSDTYVDFVGQSGKTYRYFFVDISKPIKAVEANYSFVKRLANGKYRPLYFGETDNAKNRITSDHEKWDEAIAAGLTHVMGHPTPTGEQDRLDEERDLIAYWQPELNVQHRQAK